MTQLPEPPIPADTDIRDLDGFMLNTERLMASELWALSTGEEFKAALGLWCRAWKQTPPGSLPDDARVLAAFSGAGARWNKVKAVALRGFVKCSDGRLYHEVLCEDVLRAAKKKAEQRERTRAANSRWGGHDGSDMPHKERRSQRLASARKLGKHTAEEWAAMLVVFGGACLRCGSSVNVVKDHITPIYQGGSDAIENLQPLCASCNGAKGSDTTDHRARLPDWRERLQNAMSRGVRAGAETPAKCQQNATHRQGQGQGSITVPDGTVTARDACMRRGVELIAEQCKLGTIHAQQFVAGLCKLHGDEAVEVALTELFENPKVEPRSWLKAALQGGLNGTYRERSDTRSAAGRVRASNPHAPDPEADRYL